MLHRGKTMYCIYSPYVECERGDEYAMQYGLWFSGVAFFIVFFCNADVYIHDNSFPCTYEAKER